MAINVEGNRTEISYADHGRCPLLFTSATKTSSASHRLGSVRAGSPANPSIVISSFVFGGFTAHADHLGRVPLYTGHGIWYRLNVYVYQHSCPQSSRVTHTYVL